MGLFPCCDQAMSNANRRHAGPCVAESLLKNLNWTIRIWWQSLRNWTLVTVPVTKNQQDHLSTSNQSLLVCLSAKFILLLEQKNALPFVPTVQESAHKFCCKACSNSSCAHQGARDVKEHIASKMHRCLPKATNKQPKLAFHSDPLWEKVRTDSHGHCYLKTIRIKKLL